MSGRTRAAGAARKTAFATWRMTPEEEGIAANLADTLNLNFSATMRVALLNLDATVKKRLGVTQITADPLQSADGKQHGV